MRKKKGRYAKGQTTVTMTLWHVQKVAEGKSHELRWRVNVMTKIKNKKQ